MEKGVGGGGMVYRIDGALLIGLYESPELYLIGVETRIDWKSDCFRRG